MNQRPARTRNPKTADRSAVQQHENLPLDKQRVVQGLNEFLNQALVGMNLALSFEISLKADEQDGSNGDVVVAFRGDDEALLLERNAELLLALEYIAHRWLHLSPHLHDRVRFDCGDYRITRLDELKLSARVAAQRVRETGQPFRFNPMSARERRVIHLELTGAPGVRTVSEGLGERRQLVIYPVAQRARDDRRRAPRR